MLPMMRRNIIDGLARPGIDSVTLFFLLHADEATRGEAGGSMHETFKGNSEAWSNAIVHGLSLERVGAPSNETELEPPSNHTHNRTVPAVKVGRFVANRDSSCSAEGLRGPSSKLPCCRQTHK